MVLNVSGDTPPENLASLVGEPINVGRIKASWNDILRLVTTDIIKHISPLGWQHISLTGATSSIRWCISPSPVAMREPKAPAAGREAAVRAATLAAAFYARAYPNRGPHGVGNQLRQRAAIALWKSPGFRPCSLRRQMTRGIPLGENSRVIMRGKQ